MGRLLYLVPLVCATGIIRRDRAACRVALSHRRRRRGDAGEVARGCHAVGDRCAGRAGGCAQLRRRRALEPRRPGQRRRRAGAGRGPARAARRRARAAQRQRRHGRVRVRRRGAGRSGGWTAARPQPDQRVRPPAARGVGAPEEPPDRGPDLLRPAPAAVRVQDDPGRARRAAGRQPAGRRLPRPRAGRQHCRLEPQLQREHDRRLALPLDGGRQPAAAPGRPAAGRPRHHDHARRPHGAVHRPPRARHRQPLHLLAGDARRPGGERHRHVALESPARVLLRRRRGDRPQPGHARRLGDQPRPAGPRLRDRAFEWDARERPLQHGARRRDRADDQGALRRAVRRAAVHGRHRRLRRRHPAVPLRPEPPGPARRRDPDALLPRHGHADHPRRRLRVARALHGRHRRRKPEVARMGPARVADRAQRERHVPEPVHAAGRAAPNASTAGAA